MGFAFIPFEEEKTADKMFEELGYKKTKYTQKILYINKNNKDLYITFFAPTHEVCKQEDDAYEYITMEELKAINKKCEELGWN